MFKILNRSFKTANHRRKKIKGTTTTTKGKKEKKITQVNKIQLAANDTSHTRSVFIVAALEGKSRAA